MKKLSVLLVLLAIVVLVGCASKELTSAKVYINQNNWDKAIEQLEAAIQVNPKDAEAYYLLGEGYGQKSEWEKMNDAFAKSLAISPNFEARIKNTVDRYWVMNFNQGVGKVNTKAGEQPDLQAAANLFAICTVIDPKRPEAYRNLAVTYLRMNELQKAKDTYLSLLSVDPKNMIAYNEATRLLMEMKEYPQALELAEKALAVDPANAEAISNMAMVYDLMDEKEKAQQTYEQALQRNPDNQDLLFNLARLHFLNKEYNKAIELFQKVIALNPEDFDSNLNVGNAYLTMADDLRKILIEKETNKKPVSDEEINQLKEFYRAAIPFLEKALSINSNNSTVWYNLGVAYVNIGDAQKGQECFDKAEEMRK